MQSKISEYFEVFDKGLSKPEIEPTEGIQMARINESLKVF